MFQYKWHSGIISRRPSLTFSQILQLFALKVYLSFKLYKFYLIRRNVGFRQNQYQKFDSVSDPSPFYANMQMWARICKPFKEPRNRFPAWRNWFLGSLNIYKYGNPPYFTLEKNINSRWLWFQIIKKAAMSIGPSLPPHLQHLAHREEEGSHSEDSEDSNDDFGPRLPEVACRGPAPLGPRLPEPPSGGYPAREQQAGTLFNAEFKTRGRIKRKTWRVGSVVEPEP